VIAGEQDTERGSVEGLAAVLSNAQLRRIPGDHYSALTSAALKDELASFLSDDASARRD
jgi:hypothetical protein